MPVRARPFLMLVLAGALLPAGVFSVRAETRRPAAPLVPDPWKGFAYDERVLDRLAAEARMARFSPPPRKGPLPGAWHRALGLGTVDEVELAKRARRIARHWPEERFPALRLLLGHEDASVRAQAARILGQAGDPGAPPFLERLVSDRVARVRAEALRALSRTSGRHALSLLERGLADPDVVVRRTAVLGLGNLGAGRAALVRAANAAPRGGRQPILASLARLPGRDDGPLLEEFLFSPEGVKAWRSGHADAQTLVKGLARRLDADRLEAVSAMAHASDPVIRRLALAVLEEAVSPAAVSVLLSSLQDPDEEVRGRAASALGRLGDPVAIPELVEGLMRGHMRWAGVDQALLALWRLEATTALPRLREAAAVGVGTVAPGVLVLLGHWGDKADVELLARRTSDLDPTVRLEAVRALGRLADRGLGRPCPAPPAARLGTDALLAPPLASSRPPCLAHQVEAALRDEDAGVVVAALALLTRHPSGWLLPEVMQASSRRAHVVREAAWPALAALQVPGLAEELEGSVRKGVPAALEAAWQLGGPLAALARQRALAASDPILRGRWLTKIEQGLGGKDTAADVLVFLRDAEGALRARAARLARTGRLPGARWPRPETLEPLSAARLWAGAATKPGPEGRAARGRWLGALSHPDPVMRLAATEAFGEVHAVDLRQPLALRMEDRDPEVARAAWRASLRWPAGMVEELLSGTVARGGAVARGLLDACPGGHPLQGTLARVGSRHQDPRVRWAAERLASRTGHPPSWGNP